MAARALLALVLAFVGLSFVASGASAHRALSPAKAAALRAYRDDPALARERHAATRAHTSIVGGAPASIEQMPWQVAVFAKFEFEGEKFVLLCGGSVVRDFSHVLTAGHCAYNPFTAQRLSPAAFVVAAGISSLTEIAEGPTSQARFVSEVRAHPYFEYLAGPGTPDDVAELELTKPLTPSVAVSTVALPSSSAAPQEGTTGVTSGFGEEGAGELNGNLYSLGVAIGFSRRCGGEADALFVCGSNTGGTACSGDSGGPLLGGASQQLIGVVDTVAIVSGQHCAHGAEDGFANVTAPEILDFVNGSEAPPRAPQGGGGVVIRGVIQAGRSLTCEPGGWTNGPTFSYAFVDSAGGQVLQQGASSTYSLTSADVGRTILCEARATNAGGTGMVRTSALPAIERGPIVIVPPPITSGGNSGGGGGAPPPSPPTTAQSGESSSGGVLGSTTTGVSPAQIAALLRKALTPSGKGAKIASLSKAGGFAVTFQAPEAGTTSISWYRAAAGAAALGGVAAKPLLIASGHRTFSQAGTGRIVIQLTPAGRRALRGKTHVAVSAKGSFTTSGQAPVTVSKAFTLGH